MATTEALYAHLKTEIQSIGEAGLYKVERGIGSPQSAHIRTIAADDTKSTLINFCANNYLGLADDARLISAAKQGLDEFGFGMASVRFICGTQTSHRALEAALGAIP